MGGTEGGKRRAERLEGRGVCRCVLRAVGCASLGTLGLGVGQCEWEEWWEGVRRRLGEKAARRLPILTGDFCFDTEGN